MKYIFAPLLASLLFAASSWAQLTINTPISPVVCQPLLITWSGGTPPYFLSIVPGNQPGAAATLDFGQQTGTQLTWIVNITAGTSLGLDLRDSTGTLAQSAAFTIQSSSNTACLTASTGSTTGGGSTVSSPSSSTTPVTSLTATPTSPVATSPAATTPSAANTSKASTTSKASITTSAAGGAAQTSKSSAERNMLGLGFAGAVGAAIAALIA